MRITIASLVLLLLGFSTVAMSGDVTIASKDGFELAATFYPATEPGPGVLLMHQCNRDRRSYAELASMLSKAGLHVLSFDFRGFGGSTSDTVTSYHRQRAELWPLFPQDVDAAFDYLTSQPGVDSETIGTLGASCGGSQQLLLALRRPGLRTQVYLSSSLSGISPDKIKDFSSRKDIPLLLIASKGDGKTAMVTREMNAAETHPDSAMLMYDGGEHGVPLFDQDPELPQRIVEWFSRKLH